MFSLHGLWPNSKYGESPHDCDPNSPYKSSIFDTEILNELESTWPSLFHNDNEWFWSHEWTKHGTCWANNYTEVAEKKSIFTNIKDWFLPIETENQITD